MSVSYLDAQFVRLKDIQTHDPKVMDFLLIINTSMKIKEICYPLKHFMATVRVVINRNRSTAKTTIRAETTQQAFLILTRLYGVGNVVGLTEIVSESPKTYQIHRQQQIKCPSIPRQRQPKINSQIQPSRVQHVKPTKKSRPPSKPIPNATKHELMRRRLTKQIIRQTNNLKPNIDDIRVAQSRAETALKRADFEYQKMANEFAKRGDYKIS